MSARIKLCAIAKNEGAYLADWVHHHLFYGFDGIEVWVNGTDDPSRRILRAIARQHPEVEGRSADKLLDRSLARGLNFQRRAYARLAKKARREGFTHVAFLDLDEYWVPSTGAARIQDFVPDDPAVNVVSFPWALDVPEPGAKPFQPPLAGKVNLQWDAHVKSVMRLDGSVRRFQTHTGRTRSGIRLLVRDPFPLDDERRQLGSVVSSQYLARHSATLPEAFVLHAIHRSEPEYLASLAKGLRQTGEDLPLKTNRYGFRPASTPTLSFTPPRRARRAYAGARRRFHRELGLAPVVRAAEEQTLARGGALVQALLDDESLMAEARRALRGLSLPELDHAYPGWDEAVLEWGVYGIDVQPERARVSGWAFHGSSAERMEFGVLGADDAVIARPSAVWTERPDVRNTYPTAPLRCGFSVTIPHELIANVSQPKLALRVVDARWGWTRMANLAVMPPRTPRAARHR